MNKVTAFFSFYSRAMLVFWGIFFLSLLIFNSLQYQLFLSSFSTLTQRFIIPIFFSGMFFYLTKCGLQTRLIVANSLLAVMIALYAGELYLGYRYASQKQAVIGKNFDMRDKLTVIKDMRAKNVQAYPIIRGVNLMSSDEEDVLQPILSSNEKPILPLASIPDTEVVSCNESGEWQIYKTDRHGFNNDDAQWNLPPVIGLVGDSFAHGSCVNREHNMATHLAEKFGGVINLGVGGNGPMLELVSLTEYLQPLEPPVVLWAFFEGNDITEDLPRELKSKLLQRYLNDKDFSQDLIHKNDEVKNVLKIYMDQYFTEAMQRVDGPFEAIVAYLSLDRLRQAIGVGPVQIGYNFGDLDSELVLFHKVLKEADQRVKSWGGQLYLVYLPESARYLSKVGVSPIRQRIYKEINTMALDEDIPFIDIAETFAHEPSPEKLYAYPGAHFSPEGYRLAASRIADTLKSSINTQ